MDKEYASKSAYMQPVGMKTLVVGHPFTLQSANPIDSLLDNQPYSAHAIQTIDTIAFADSNEFMRSYVLNNIEAYRLFIQLMGRTLFEIQSTFKDLQHSAKRSYPL